MNERVRILDNEYRHLEKGNSGASLCYPGEITNQIRNLVATSGHTSGKP